MNTSVHMHIHICIHPYFKKSGSCADIYIHTIHEVIHMYKLIYT